MRDVHPARICQPGRVVCYGSPVFGANRRAISRIKNLESQAGVENGSQHEMIMKRFSALTWYRVLRLHHHRSVLEAVRYAFWLAR
jgi:hypothetical protein